MEFDDISKLTTVELQSAVSEICDWRANPSLRDMWNLEFLADYNIMYSVSIRSLTALSVDCKLNNLKKITVRVCFMAIAFLHVAYKISQNDFNDDVMDALSATIVGPAIGPRRYSSQRSSALLLSKAANVIKL